MLELFCNVNCPFARRGMLAVHEKGLDCKLIAIPLGGHVKMMVADGLDSWPQAAVLFPGKTVDDIVQIKEDYMRDINPTGEVPTLGIVNADGITEYVGEADVVAEFVEDAFPDSGFSLMPKNDPLGRSRVRHYIKIVNGPYGAGAMYGCIMNQDPAQDEAKRAAVHKGMEEFARLANDDGPFFLGEQFSLADLMLLPMWDQFRYILPHWRGVELIPSGDEHAWAPRMRQWAAAVEQRESFKTHSKGKEVYIPGYAPYAGARGLSEFGK